MRSHELIAIQMNHMIWIFRYPNIRLPCYLI